jgi:hypothetical protein
LAIDEQSQEPKPTKNKQHEKTNPPPAPAISSTGLAQLPGIGCFSGGQNVLILAPVIA